MNRTLSIVIILIATCLASCAFSAKKKSEAISALEESVKQSAKNHLVDTTKIKELLADYDYYYKHYPQDSLTPGYLLRSGEFNEAVGNMDKSIDLYHRIYTEYPKYPKAGEALFREAFAYDNSKHDLPKAKELYTQYLTQYPTAKMNKEAKFLLMHLGQTPEQMMAELDSLQNARRHPVENDDKKP